MLVGRYMHVQCRYFLSFFLALRACHTLAISLNDRVTHKKIAERWRALTIAGPSLCYRRERLSIVVDRR